jgi:hypothetical protein
MLRNQKLYTELLNEFYAKGSINLAQFYPSHKEDISKNTLYSQYHTIERIDAILSDYLKDREIKKEIQTKLSLILFAKTI